MRMTDLVSWGRDRDRLPQRKGASDSPLLGLQNDMNRLFEDFWSGLERAPGMGGQLTTGTLRTDISESDEEVEVTVELPGIEEKDVDVSLTGDALTIRGEKKSEREEKKKAYYVSERSYGTFHRTIPLPPGIDTEKVAATFKNGVLSVKMPKTPDAKSRVKRIEVQTS